jgi:nucleotide-binding universal stress UspA family protein
MRHFKNILCVIHGTYEETTSLKHAISLAHRNGASLTMLVICPELPGRVAAYKEKFESALLQEAEASVAKICELVGVEMASLKLAYRIDSGETPAVRVIRHVLRDHFDLVIKEVEQHSHRAGFRSVDMNLLSKCPCPVWLCRETDETDGPTRIAVAVDPEEKGDARDMTLRMLELSANLAQQTAGDLHIVSCWHYALEGELKHNIFIHMADEELEKEKTAIETEHRAALEDLLNQAKLDYPSQLHHLEGRASDSIARFVREEAVDILVMGTVARTGISGFLVGNTAENIFQQLESSLIALKPAGFECPVKL